MVRVIAFGLACLPVLVNADPATDAMASVRTRLEVHPVVRMEFVQTRTVAGLAKPVLTRGRLLYWHKQGVLWQVEQPYRATYAIERDSITEIAADGTRMVRTEADAPAAVRISRAVRSAMGSDPSVLNSWFGSDARLEGSRWQLALTPRQSTLARQIKSIRLSGAEFVEDVLIDAVNGDETRIEFRNHKTDPPTDQERRAFSSG